MKNNLFTAVCAVIILAGFIGSVCLFGGYAAIVGGSILAAALAAPGRENSPTA